MYRLTISCALALATAGCASVERTAFDPSVDERIGKEVRSACYSRAAGASGGYKKIGDWDAFITGESSKPYLLVFSSGCRDIGAAGGAVPVFRNYGGNCRRRGELVQISQPGFGLGGGCTIAHIYEWDRVTNEDPAD